MKRRLMVLMVAFGLMLGACSGDSTEEGVASLEVTETTASTADTKAGADSDTAAAVIADDVPTEVDQEQVMLAFAACMRENGVEIEDPTVDADGNVGFGRLRSAIEGDVDPEAIEAAREACEGELEGVALRSGGDRDRTAEQDVFLEFASCMRDNGFDMPDPDFSNTGPGSEGGGGGVGPFGELDRNDPDFVAAIPACQDILSGTGPEGNGPPGITG